MQVEIQRMRLRIYGFNLFGDFRARFRGRSRQHRKKSYCGRSHRVRMISAPRLGCKLVILSIAARCAFHTEVASVSLNLRLPSGQMAVQAKAPTATAAVKSAFDDLLQQVNRHKEILRSSHKWSRRGASARPSPQLPQVPFEQTLAAVHPPTV